MSSDTYDLIVIGAGAGGTGAAIMAGRLGLRVLWVEKEHTLGGTGVHALVNVWQPSLGRSELCREIAQRLLATGDGVLASGACDTPTGRPLYRADPSASYEQTLSRWGPRGREQGFTAPLFVYDPSGMAALLQTLARETGQVEVATDTLFLSAQTATGSERLRRVDSVELLSPEGLRTVRARWVVDATAEIEVARAVGCGWTIGREPRETYDEPSAPEQPQFRLNAWTLCFVCEEGPERVQLPAEQWGSSSPWAHIGELPRGGFYVNMCLQLPGEAGWRMGHEQARELLLRNIARRWPLAQEAYGLQGYGISQLAPRIGVREGPRLFARYVLTEHDFRAGNRGRHHPDCVAWTEHAMDRHSEDGGCVEAENGPVGIPLRCLQPREYDNLLVASRGAGFSSLAASAVRLQRTLIALGEAAAHHLAAQ